MSKALQTRVTSIARGQLGVSEGWGPHGWNNRVRYTMGTKWLGQPWCVWFCVWVARRAGIGPECMPTMGSASALRRWAIQHGRLDSWPDRLPAVVLINSRPGSRTPVHVGLAIEVAPDAVETIEGNKARKGQSQGSIVGAGVRNRDRVVGSVYIGQE